MPSSNAVSPTRPGRVAFLDGLRALAALAVLAHHAYSTVYPIDYGRRPSGALGYLTGPLMYGHFAVTAFIVLAGYSLTLSAAGNGGRLRGGLGGFVKRRGRRILPPYWLALLLSPGLSCRSGVTVC